MCRRHGGYNEVLDEVIRKLGAPPDHVVHDSAAGVRGAEPQCLPRRIRQAAIPAGSVITPLLRARPPGQVLPGATAVICLGASGEPTWEPSVRNDSPGRGNMPERSGMPRSAPNDGEPVRSGQETKFAGWPGAVSLLYRTPRQLESRWMAQATTARPRSSSRKPNPARSATQGRSGAWNWRECTLPWPRWTLAMARGPLATRELDSRAEAASQPAAELIRSSAQTTIPFD